MVQITDIRTLMTEVWQVGYMEAVKAYEPIRDEIRKSDIPDWLALMNVDKRTFRTLERCGLVKARKMNDGRNSPLVYSKVEIKKALATRTASRLYVNDITTNSEKIGAGGMGV